MYLRVIELFPTPPLPTTHTDSLLLLSELFALSSAEAILGGAAATSISCLRLFPIKSRNGYK